MKQTLLQEKITYDKIENNNIKNKFKCELNMA